MAHSSADCLRVTSRNGAELYYLRRAVSQLQSSNGSDYDVDNDRRYGGLVREIEDSVEGWPSAAGGLLDTDNWRIDRLLEADGALRKPKAWLDTFVTSRGNLALDWYPGRREEHSDSEFRYFSDEWPIGGGQLPFNRIVMLREFDRLQRFGGQKYSLVDRFFLNAIRDHLHYVETALSDLCDVSIHRRLYLDYDNPSGSIRDRKIVGVSIYEVLVVEQELQEAKREAWLRARFEDQFGVTAAQFLEAFRDSSGVFARTGKILRERVRMKTTMDGSQVKRLVIRLYHEHSDLYDSTCSFSPKGEDPRATAQVINLHDRR